MGMLDSKTATAGDPRSRGGRPAQITLDPSWPMADALDRLTAKLDVPIEDVMTQAVALFMVAVEAQERGQRLCLADDDLNIKGEIVDFGAAREPIGIDPFPERGSDRLDG